MGRSAAAAEAADGYTLVATIIDTLETVMTLQGADTVISGLTNLSTRLLENAAAGDVLKGAQARLKAAQAELLSPLTLMIANTTQLTANLFQSVAGFGAMAASEGVAAAATAVLTAAVDLLFSPLVLITGLLAGLTAGAVVAARGLSAFSQSEDTIGRLAVRMQNLGNVFPIKELIEFSGRLGDQLGIDDEVITKLGVMAASFGLTRQQIERMIPAVLDIATFNKMDPEQVLEKIIRASRGRPQGLIALGIDPTKVKGDLHDINNLITQLGESFKGTAEAFRETLPQVGNALKVATENFEESIGRFFAPAAIAVGNTLIFQLQSMTALFSQIADFLGIPTAADIGIGGKGTDLALKGDPEQTELMRQTANNTKQMNDQFVQKVLGGSGAIAKGAFTQRDAVMAFGI